MITAASPRFLLQGTEFSHRTVYAKFLVDIVAVSRLFLRVLRSYAANCRCVNLRYTLLYHPGDRFDWYTVSIDK